MDSVVVGFELADAAPFIVSLGHCLSPPGWDGVKEVRMIGGEFRVFNPTNNEQEKTYKTYRSVLISPLFAGVLRFL
jgi:hypothetical protein